MLIAIVLFCMIICVCSIRSIPEKQLVKFGLIYFPLGIVGFFYSAYRAYSGKMIGLNLLYMLGLYLCNLIYVYRIRKYKREKEKENET